ncbi:MAG TPA: LysR family transcriptional regulator [Usitatibacter sp.]|nr:LysR family transcriptional regulator [Usitatibacter sp.]
MASRIDRAARRLKIRDLDVFMAVAQAGGMGKAATRLHTSQPAISRSISALEQALGVRLLERGPRGVEPTEYGRALLEGSIAVFDDLRRMAGRIESLADPDAGEVRIGTTTFLAASVVSAVVDRLSRRHSRMAFVILTASGEALHRELVERNVDLLVVRRFAAAAEEEFGFEHLFDDSFVVAASAQSPWARRRRIQLAELAHEPWLLPPPESVASQVAREIFRASGVAYPRPTVVTLTAEVRMSLLSTGRFVTILPESVLRYPVKRADLKVLPVALPPTRVPNGIVTIRDRRLGPAAERFLECMREVARSPAK